MKVLCMEQISNKKTGKRSSFLNKVNKYTTDIYYCVIENNKVEYNVMLEVSKDYVDVFEIVTNIEFEILKIFKGTQEAKDLDFESVNLCINQYFESIKEKESQGKLIVHETNSMGERYENNSLYKSFRLFYTYNNFDYVTILECIHSYNDEIFDDDDCFVIRNAGEYFTFDKMSVCKDVNGREWTEIVDKERLRKLEEYIKEVLMSQKKLNDYKKEYPYKELKE